MGLHGGGVWGMSPANQKGAVRKRCPVCRKYFYPESWAGQHHNCIISIPVSEEERQKNTEADLEEARKFWLERERRQK